MIGDLLPISVATSESTAATGQDVLFPEEIALIARAQPTRAAEFATARHCARCALAQLDIVPGPILKGASREPLWPDGIVGSITHCAGYHAAAVAQATDFCSLGIDAEPNEPLPDGVLEEVTVASERKQLRRTADAHLDRVLFSAKESLYKAWFPLARRWLDFDQARIVVNLDGTFEARVTADGPLRAALGSWLVRAGLVATALAIPSHR